MIRYTNRQIFRPRASSTPLYSKKSLKCHNESINRFTDAHSSPISDSLESPSSRNFVPVSNLHRGHNREVVVQGYLRMDRRQGG